jgi:uncharacterized protein YceK
VRKALTILAIAATISGCSGMVKKKQALEQEAISTAISLCRQFGHAEGTIEFTRCAEQRYMEVLTRRQ